MRLFVFVLISLLAHLILFLPLNFKISLGSKLKDVLVVDRLGGSLSRSAGDFPRSRRVGSGDLSPISADRGLEGMIDKIVEGNPKPPYPAMARRLRLEGQAVIRILISRSGEIKDIHFQKTTGHSLLDDAILKTVRTWKIPSSKKEAWLTLPPFEFKLKKDS